MTLFSRLTHSLCLQLPDQTRFIGHPAAFVKRQPRPARLLDHGLDIGQGCNPGPVQERHEVHAVKAHPRLEHAGRAVQQDDARDRPVQEVDDLGLVSAQLGHDRLGQWLGGLDQEAVDHVGLLQAQTILGGLEGGFADVGGGRIWVQKTDIIVGINILNVSKAYGLSITDGSSTSSTGSCRSSVDPDDDPSMIDKTEMAVALTCDDHVDHVGLLQLYSLLARLLDLLLALAPAVGQLATGVGAIVRVRPAGNKLFIADITTLRPAVTMLSARPLVAPV